MITQDVEVASNGIAIMTNQLHYVSFQYNILTHQLRGHPDGAREGGTGNALRSSHDRNHIVGFQNGNYHYEYNAIEEDMIITPQFGGGQEEGYFIKDALLSADGSVRVQIEGWGSSLKCRVIVDELEVGVITPEGSTTDNNYTYALSNDGNRLYTIISDLFNRNDPKPTYFTYLRISQPKRVGRF